MSSLFMPSATSSFFSEEIRLSSERQLGLRKTEPKPDHSGLDGMSLMHVNKSMSSSTLEKLCPIEGNCMNLLELPQTFLSEEQQVRLLSNDTHFGKYLEVTNSEFVEDEPLESMKEIEAQRIGDLLPNDDDLLSGVIGDIDCFAQTNIGDEDDLFCSGGGMEMESDESFNHKRASGFVVGGSSNSQIHGLTNTITSGLIKGEHPSRALILSNFNINVEDTDLRILFEQFGDIHEFCTANKHSGFIIVSYYDIRAAKNAKRAFQDRLLRRQKLNIQYYVPKDNAPDKEINHATLIVFNLCSDVSNDNLHQLFGSYGEIKEIFHDPYDQNQRAIEFFDVRAAEAALCALNMSAIAGKIIEIKLGFPGAKWRCSGEHSSLGLEQEKPIIFRRSDSPYYSLPVPSVPITYGANSSMCIDSPLMHGSTPRNLISPLMKNESPGTSTVTRNTSSPIRITMVGNHGRHSSHDELSNSFRYMNFGFQSIQTISPHSLPEFNHVVSSIPASSLSNVLPMQTTKNSRIGDEIFNQRIHRVGAGQINSHSSDHKEASRVPGNGVSPFNEHQYVLNNSNANFHQSPGSFLWRNSPSFINNIPAPRPLNSHGLPRGQSHVGSAPVLKPSPRERHNTYAGDCLETPFHPGSLGNISLSGNSQIHSIGSTSHNIFLHNGVNYIGPSVSPAQQISHMFHERNSMITAPPSFNAPSGWIRSLRSDASVNQVDNKKQFELDIDRIIRGEGSRTTLMIKNIPNKYTSKMLLATIDEHHKGTYDFIYLPIDFKNKCNVGYAFINLTDPKNIIPFYQAFNGKKWEKFNSEKVASLAYARIQGKEALISHFQNSSLMNEDKRCRPILFHSDGPNAGNQEAFPIGAHIRSRPGRSRINNNEEHQQGSPYESDSGTGEELFNSTESSLSYTKDSK